MHAKSHHLSRQSQSFKKRKRYKTAAVVSIIIVAICLWAFVIVRFTDLSALNIDSVNVTGADSISTAAIQAAVMQSIEGKYLGIFPKSNILIYPKNSIFDAIKAVDPDIDSVTVGRDGTHALGINVKQKSPKAVVCSDYPNFNAGGDIGSLSHDGCYYSDERGLLFARSPEISGDAYHRYYAPSLSDATSTDGIIGSYATSTDEFVKIEKFYTGALKNGILTKAVLIKDGGEYEMYVESPKISGETSSVLVVYFNNARPFDEELSNLIAFWSNLVSSKASKEKLALYDYIDVRYGANIFYK